MPLLSPAAGAKNRSLGFTLMEVMCVVVILAIAAAMVCAGMSNQSDLNSVSAARAVMADLLYAQNRAIATQQNVYVIFNTGAGPLNGVPADSYALCSSLNPLTELTNPTTQASYVSSWASQSWSVTSASLSGQNAMYFDELGTPWSCSNTGGSPAGFTSGGGTVTIGSGNESIQISIQPSTGDVTVGSVQ